MGIININGIRLHAYHGCLPEEAKLGTDYRVDVSIETDFSASEKTDKLADTVDYCDVYAIVKKEMEIRSKLIEHVCRRILDGLTGKWPKAHIEVEVTKLRPPIQGDVESVSVILHS
ncbi:MAG TPA: dihydroneopterin aldolase [Bacteroidia bacterium]|jgi:dihydroneopterin aldolase|nr:dihydroneopterin aldolase [Bacteroidia bacterium]